MKIGIDASKLGVLHKTGTEYYAEAVITGLLQSIPPEHQIILYSQKPLSSELLSLHPHTVNHIIKTRYMWTLWGLSWELLRHPVDIFYTPASIIPPIHPKKSIIVIHGLEYEAFPQAYSLLRFWHLALFTQLSAHWAYKVITPSQSTREDLSSEYDVDIKKIHVIPSGIPDSMPYYKSENIRDMVRELSETPFLFMIGRKELRKNLITVIHAFNKVKTQHKDVKLVLAGDPGYGYKDIEKAIKQSPHTQDIIELGRVTDEEKDLLYKHAHIVLYPSYYEGFGFPILEALQYGTTVIASDIPSSREVGMSMIQYISTEDIPAWAEAISISLKDMPSDIVCKGRQEYVKQFTFVTTVKNTQDIILS